ncbi:MAG: hypothetical protein R3Y21_04530 [Mycoplasmatota bacterium]
MNDKNYYGEPVENKVQKIINIKKKITVIGLGIILLFTAFVIYLLNVEKVALTEETFESYMEEKGLLISDITDQVSDYDYVEYIAMAIKEDFTYQIEFCIFSDEDHAIDFYDSMQESAEEESGNSSVELSLNMPTYASYTLSSDDTYILISRIDNTVIYLIADSIYEEEIKEIMSDLDY